MMKAMTLGGMIKMDLIKKDMIIEVLIRKIMTNKQKVNTIV